MNKLLRNSDLNKPLKTLVQYREENKIMFDTTKFKKITLLERFLLLFVKKKYSYSGDYCIVYKKMNNKLYVIGEYYDK